MPQPIMLIRAIRAAVLAFSQKYSSTTEMIAFDFTDVLGAGVNITSATISVSVVSGTDPTPTAMLSGSPAYIPGVGGGSNNTVVRQLITGGVAGVTYLFTCSVTGVSSGSTPANLAGKLSVVAP